MILSFDIGIKNLAYCIIDNYDSPKYSIVSWDIIQLIDDNTLCKNVNLNQITNILYVKLFNIFQNYENIKYILLENQPVLKNPVMKSIQIIIFGFFNYQKIILNRNIQEINFINASNKLKVSKYIKEYTTEQLSQIDKINNIKNKYNINKKFAILYTNHFLIHYIQDYQNHIEIFNSHKKKDDLSDAFLQSLYFIKYKLKL